MSGTVEGERIDVGFSGRRCIHSRNCVLGHPRCLRAQRARRMDPSRGGRVEKIVAIAACCPSGAITYVAQRMAARRNAADGQHRAARENGPLALHARICSAARGSSAPRSAVAALSRTSRSATAATARAASSPPASRPLKDMPALAARDGPLTVTPQTNGPLKLEGNVEIVSGTGHTIDRATNAPSSAAAAIRPTSRSVMAATSAWVLWGRRQRSRSVTRPLCPAGHLPQGPQGGRLAASPAAPCLQR